MKRNLIVVAACLLAGTLLVAQTSALSAGAEQPKITKPAEQKQMAFPGLPECAKAAVVDGDPTKGAGVLSAEWPAGCKVPMHWHTANESLMIVSGTADVGMKGQAAQTVSQGAFIHMPAQHQHEFTCTSACTFYLVTDGAFDIHYAGKDGKEISAEQALGKSGDMSATKQ